MQPSRHHRIRVRAFTLIELLVAMSIIAVLFASLFAASSMLIGKAKSRETESLLNVVQQAIDEFEREQTETPTLARRKSYRDRFGRFPPDELEAVLVGAGKAIVPAPPYTGMTFHAEELPPMNAALEHRDLAALVLAIELYGKTSRTILDGIPERNRVAGPVDDKGDPVQFLDLDGNGNWDPTDTPIRYIVDGWGVPLGYFAQRDWTKKGATATESKNHSAWNEASTELIRLNGGRPIVFSYGANGKEQLTSEAMTTPDTTGNPTTAAASLVGDFEDGDHKVANVFNADNVYVDPSLRDKLAEGI